MIDTDRVSDALRTKTIHVPSRAVLITDFRDSAQEEDNPDKINCGGFGRLRTFRRHSSPGWVSNPLPIDPAASRLGLPPSDVLRAQVFQTASCNWRCWYCYVPFHLLAGNKKFGSLLTAAELVDLYQRESNPCRVLDLSGGQPDLTPEWIPWMMAELTARGLSSSVYLWSDDNLSNDFFWRFLSPADIRVIAAYRNYGKVCCFKGFDAASFAFNTGADSALFGRQFDLARRYLDLPLDLYGYTTFTATTDAGLAAKMREFVDRLQAVREHLPLRVVPLQVDVFTAVKARLGDVERRAMEIQWVAIEYWNEELTRRFTDHERSLSVHNVPL